MLSLCGFLLFLEPRANVITLTVTGKDPTAKESHPCGKEKQAAAEMKPSKGWCYIVVAMHGYIIKNIVFHHEEASHGKQAGNNENQNGDEA